MYKIYFVSNLKEPLPSKSNTQPLYCSPNILFCTKNKYSSPYFPTSVNQLPFISPSWYIHVVISLVAFSSALVTLASPPLPQQTTSSSHMPPQRNKRTNLILLEFHTLFFLLLKLSHELCKKTLSVLHFFYAFESIVLSILHGKLTES